MQTNIVGHRGLSGDYPENTKASILAAIESGLKWIEIDIQPTKDGQLVVIHDHTIDRCSNGSGRVDSFTLAELQQFDFGAWYHDDFVGEPILTFSELLNLAKYYDLSLNIEVKLDTDCAVSVVRTMQKQLEIANIDKHKLLLSSFSAAVIRQLALQCPEYRLGVIGNKLTEQYLQLLREFKVFSCHLNYQYITADDIETLKREGYQIWCFTVNQVGQFPLLGEVDAIFSDFPLKFMK